MYKIYIIAALLLAVSITSCTRENEVIVPDTSLKGGKKDTTGALIRVTPQFHEQDIDSCTVYIAYAKDKGVALASYDEAKLVMIDEGRPRARFDSLMKGTYYLYCEGYDKINKQKVKGGAKFNVVDTTVTTYDLYIQTYP